MNPCRFSDSIQFQFEIISSQHCHTLLLCRVTFCLYLYLLVSSTRLNVPLSLFKFRHVDAPVDHFISSVTRGRVAT